MPADRLESAKPDNETSNGWPRLAARLRAEFDLAILSVFGGSAAIVVGAFAIYRFWSGSVIGGIVDVGIALGLGAVVLYAWKGSNVARAGAIFVGFAVVACVASSMVFGRTAAYWAFLVLSISFVVTGPRAAVVGCLILIAALASREALFTDLPERAIFVVTALLVTLYSWIVHTRYDAQREQLEVLANHDPLTHAGNRRLLRKAMVETVAAQRAQGTPAMLAVLDLDHFKAVNDTHGHEAGDRVLTTLADIVRERLRRGDSLYRLGGEEFVVLFTDTPADRGETVVHDLHRLIDAGMLDLGIPVTVSIGAASLAPGEDWAAWLRRADQAMYRAKQAGRDRVVIDTAPAPDQPAPERRGSPGE